jgi:hypothetical protein
MEIKRIDLDQDIVPKETKSSAIYSDTQSIPKDKVMSKQSTLLTLVLFVIAVGAGILTGAYLKTNKTIVKGGSSATTENIQAQVPVSGVKVGDIYGSADEKGFKDSVTGVVDKGGLNGEGTHKLVRPGGVSQTVYLTSSVIDLDQLVGDQVTIWGETFKGQKVGWLMDVGRAKVENLNAPLPK